jgi:hypothetical protein
MEDSLFWRRIKNEQQDLGIWIHLRSVSNGKLNLSLGCCRETACMHGANNTPLEVLSTSTEGEYFRYFLRIDFRPLVTLSLWSRQPLVSNSASAWDVPVYSISQQGNTKSLLMTY